MNWSDEANEILAELMHELPAPERPTVQEAAKMRAEALTEEDGEDEVAMETAVRAFIESTPTDLRNRLRRALTYHGIDPEEYVEAFEE